MSSAFEVSALGVVVRIDLDDSVSESMALTVRRQWADALVTDAASPVIALRYGVRHGSDAPILQDPPRSVVKDEASLPSRIATDVTYAALRAMSGAALLFHACAVALDDGRVIGFVGPSGRGKTTAAQRLGEDFGYVTDEALGVRFDGAVLPYAKPLSIGRHPQRKSQVAPSELGMRSAPGGRLELAALVLLDRRDDVDEPYVESVRLRDAIPELAENISYFAIVPRPLRTLSEAMLRTGGVRRAVYRDAASLADLVPGILRTTDSEPPVLSEVPDPSPPTPRGSDARERPADWSYRRAPHTDAIRVDGELFIFRDHEILRLSDLGAAVWLAGDDSTADDVYAAAMQTLDAPPLGVDAGEAVQRVLHELIDAGLMTRR